MKIHKSRTQKLLDAYNINVNKYLHSVAKILEGLRAKKTVNNWLKRTQISYQKVLTAYDLLLRMGKNPELELLRKELPKEFATEQLIIEGGDVQKIEEEANKIISMLLDSLKKWKSLFGIEPSVRSTYNKTH